MNKPLNHILVVAQKLNKMVGHDAPCPQGKLDNNMARAQFIVPLQVLPDFFFFFLTS